MGGLMHGSSPAFCLGEIAPSIGHSSILVLVRRLYTSVFMVWNAVRSESLAWTTEQRTGQIENRRTRPVSKPSLPASLNPFLYSTLDDVYILGQFEAHLKPFKYA